MTADTRRIVLDIAKGESDSKPTAIEVCFCAQSASLLIGELAIHIPWTELVEWHMWLAVQIENQEE